MFIDDYHLMEDNKVKELILSLCDIPVKNFHIIIATRSMTFLQDERLHFGSRMHRITIDDLRLNKTDLSIYCRQCGVSLSNEELIKLYECSEGWLSYVYLNLKSFMKHTRLLEETTDISTMIGSALIEPLSSNEKEILIKMCLADEFAKQEAAYITEIADADNIIENLSSNNSFIRYLSDTKTYRFHHLLRDYLMLCLREKNNEYNISLQNRYGAWYELQGEHIKALSCYQNTKNNCAALHIIGIDAGVQLASISPHSIMVWLEKCSDKELMSEPQGILVLMRRLFSWRNISKMMELKEILVKVANNENTLEIDKNNLLGECDLIMSFLKYNNIEEMSKLHQSTCKQMTHKAISIEKMTPIPLAYPQL